MNRVTYPLNFGMKGPDVVDLQEALRILLDRGAILRDDPSARQTFAEKLEEERASEWYGEWTRELVIVFQTESDLESSGEVDGPTADALNALIEGGQGNSPIVTVIIPCRDQVVSGEVRREDGFPLRGVRVSAFHGDGRAVRLGTDVTDAEGRYTIRYELLPELPSVDLLVVATNESGVPLASSAVLGAAKKWETIDLSVPVASNPSAKRLGGRVLFENGMAAENLRLRLYRRNFGGTATMLSTTTTLGGGVYSLTFSTSGPALILEVRAVDGAGTETTLSKPLTVSVDETPPVVDLVAPTSLRPLESEYERITFANGTATESTYDPMTFRLRRLRSVRQSDGKVLQDLAYTHDPAGNITELRDGAQQDLFYANAVVSADGLYRYDALYRLVEAEGREHPGQQPTNVDLPWSALPHANDVQAMQRYQERYTYDKVGNILEMAHTSGGAGWTRRYEYDSESNRLLSTSLPSDPPNANTQVYAHDPAGNMIRMPHLAGMAWDWAGRFQQADKGGGGTVYFTYDVGGQRVRKVYEHSGVIEERIYIGTFELFRRRQSGAVQLERETLHLMDDKRRIAMIETKTRDGGADLPSPESRHRYQLDNHLDSAVLEVDETGQVISYEEYFPYGTTSFRALTSGVDASEKRYRYTGKERDDETGFYCLGARHYAAWLGRWISADPKGFVDGTNVFAYTRNNPVNLSDPTGTQSVGDEELVPPTAIPEQDIKAKWQQEASRRLGTPPSEKRTVFERNRRITRAYADMYLSNPALFKWAGMAAFASAEVGEGMQQGEALRTSGLPWIPGVSDVSGTELLNALAVGNWIVFDDIYWQFLAYQSGGIAELERAFLQEGLTLDVMKAWRTIDQGAKTNDQALVWEGNMRLLRFEQEVVLQTDVYDKNRTTFQRLSQREAIVAVQKLNSPIPGDGASFQQFVPGGDIGKFEDRWKWIDGSMLPAWKHLSADDAATRRELGKLR